jgi:hypothetical protein
MNEEGSSFGVPPKNKPAKLYYTRKCTTKESLTRGVSHYVALPFTLTSILRQKKNYGSYSNSYFTIAKKNINLQKIL